MVREGSLIFSIYTYNWVYKKKLIDIEQDISVSVILNIRV